MRGSDSVGNELGFVKELKRMQLTEAQILQCLMESRIRLSAAAWLVTRDAHAAEDVFQNMALKAITRKVVFENEGALMSWAYIVVRREGIDWLRRHQRIQLEFDDELFDLMSHEWTQKGNNVPAGGRLEALSHCLDGLPDKSRSLLNLRYFEGFNCSEIAAHIGIDLNAVYKRLSRLHLSLRQCVERKMTAAVSEQ